MHNFRLIQITKLVFKTHILGQLHFIITPPEMGALMHLVETFGERTMGKCLHTNQNHPESFLPISKGKGGDLSMLKCNQMCQFLSHSFSFARNKLNV